MTDLDQRIEALEAVNWPVANCQIKLWRESVIEAMSVIRELKAERDAALKKHSVTLTGFELRDAFYFTWPDYPNEPDQAETEVCIELLDAGVFEDGEERKLGHYLSFAEYPEEGIIGPLGEYKS